MSEAIGTHSWKIALRVRTHNDYHYMKISNTSNAAGNLKQDVVVDL